MKEFDINRTIESMQGMNWKDWAKVKAVIDVQFSEIQKESTLDACDIQSAKIRTAPFRITLPGRIVDMPHERNT